MRLYKDLQGVLMFRMINFIFLYLFLVFFTTCTLAQIQSQSLPEIHLLVDVSASMKQTDPHNHRVAAIQILNYLLFNKAKLSIFTFAAEPKNLIPLHIVDDYFIQSFKNKRHLITSNGALTNIEKALVKANAHWSTKKRIIILLTDGKLDVGSNVMNESVVDQLMKNVLPVLQQNHVQVFTLGFSKDADRALLKSISNQSNGISQFILSSDDLDHSLFKIYMATIETEGTSINKKSDLTRTFSIDKSVNELSLIIELNDNDSSLLLTQPNGKTLAINQDNSTVFSINKYRLFKMTSPPPGEWILTGKPQVVEKAILLTDLKLSTNFKSGIYFNQEWLSLSGFYEDHGQLLNSPLLMNNTEMTLEINNDIEQINYKIPYAGEGLFQLKFNLAAPKGTYNARWIAKNTLFSREHQLLLQIEENPFYQSVNNHLLFKLGLIAPELIEEKSVQVTVRNNENNLTQYLTKKNAVWEMDLKPYCNQSKKDLIEVQTEINAKTISGRAVYFSLVMPRIKCAPVNGYWIQAMSHSVGKIAQIIRIHHQGISKVVAQTLNRTPANEKPTTFDPDIMLFIKTILLLLLVAVAFIYFVKLYFKIKIKNIRDKNE